MSTPLSPLVISPPPSQALTRFDSPSSQSTTSLLTPVDPNASFDQGSSSGSGRSRKGFGLMYQSKSIGSLRNRVGEDKMRSRPGLGDRALTTSETESPMQHNNTMQPTQPIHIQSNPASRPRPTRSGSSFSSFIRKLTGRSASPPKPTNEPTQKYSTTSSRITRKPSLPQLQTDLPNSSSYASTVPRSAPPARGFIPFSPPIPVPDVPKRLDPVNIPLPPSPMSSYAKLLEAEEGGEVGYPSLVSGPSLKEIKQVGALSLGGGRIGVEKEEIQEDEEEQEELIREQEMGLAKGRGRGRGAIQEDEEEEDTIQPLRPIQIPGSASSGRTRSVSPSTPITATITTPTSSIDDRRFAGSSPPRKAPVGTGAGLVRKESKWRKSVYGLSETLNNGVSRKNTTKTPPTSFDSYAAHQQRIARNRVSCAPTLHSTASIAAEIREIKDKEQVDVIETFFMS